MHLLLLLSIFLSLWWAFQILQPTPMDTVDDGNHESPEV